MPAAGSCTATLNRNCPSRWHFWPARLLGNTQNADGIHSEVTGQRQDVSNAQQLFLTCTSSDPAQRAWSPAASAKRMETTQEVPQVRSVI